MMTGHYSTGRATPKCTDRRHSKHDARRSRDIRRVPPSSLAEQAADVAKPLAQRVVLGEFRGIVGVHEALSRRDEMVERAVEGGSSPVRRERVEGYAENRQ